MRKIFMIFCLSISLALTSGCGNSSQGAIPIENKDSVRIAHEMTHLRMEIKELEYFTYKQIDSLRVKRKNGFSDSDTLDLYKKVQNGRSQIKNLIEKYDSLENLPKN